MKKLKTLSLFMVFAISIIGNAQNNKEAVKKDGKASFSFLVEQFSDIKVLRYQIPGWENLTLK